MRKFKYILPLTLLLGTTVEADTYQIQLTPSIDFSQITGFMQIPRGGTANSTSYHRPTFKEMNVRHNNRYNLDLAVTQNGHRVYLGYTYNRFNKRATLSQNLITHNQFIAAGSSVRFKVGLDWLRAGYEYPLWQTQELNLGLIGEAAYLMSRYQFQAPLTQSKRNFGGFNLRFGAKIDNAHNHNLVSSIQATTSLPIINAYIFNLGYELNYHGNAAFSPFIGAGFTYIQFKDGQRLPNHVRYTNLPYIRLGVHFNTCI